MAGYGEINYKDGKQFSKDYQPKNRRKSTKFLTELLTKNLKVKKEIEIEGTDVVTGAKVRIKVPMPTKDVIVQALIRKAAKGDVIAIKEIFDRTEGRVAQGIELANNEGGNLFETMTDEQIEAKIKQLEKAIAK